MRIGFRLRDIIWYKAYDILELAIALPLILLSLQLLNPYFSTFDNNPNTYRAMASLAPEWVWGSIGAVLGSTGIYATLWERPVLRIVVPFCMMFFLIFYAGCLGFVNPNSPGVGTYLGMALCSVLVFLRALRGIT